MPRPPVVVVCTNVAQAGRIAQGFGTRHGHEGSVHHQDLRSPRSTKETPSGRTRNSAGARRSTGVRIWKVYEGDTLHEVHDLGTHLEARSEDGSKVWTGVRLSSGEYQTQSTTLPADELASFLDKVHDGDQTTPRGHNAPVSALPAAPASTQRGTRAQRTTSTPASETMAKAPREEQAALPARRRGRRKKTQPASSAQPKSRAPASAQPKSRAPASAQPKSKAAASSKSRQPPKARTKRQPTAKTTVSAPPTSRSPGSQHETPESMRRRLHEKNPDTPAAALETLEDIWRGGASVPAKAWMIAQGFTDLADAFVDWVDHHTSEANGYMQAGKALRSA